MPEVSEATLADMARLLKTGPIVIGENHEVGFARKAIIRLIDMKAVSYLSLESPIGPQNMSKDDGEIKEIDKYLGAVSSVPNPHLSFETLVKYARKSGIPVYCHDIPAIRSPLNYAGESDPALKKADTFSTYPNYARQFLPGTRMDDLPTAKQAASRFVHRNHYAANYLREKLGKGVRVLFGLVVLAGSDHIRDEESGRDDTLQACLEIDSNRAFICE